MGTADLHNRVFDWPPIVSLRTLCKMALLLVCVLSPLENLKVMDVQPVEVGLLFLLCGASVGLHRNGWRAAIPLPLKWLGIHYCSLLVMASVFAILSLRFEYHVPVEAADHLLKQPGILPLSKLVELALVILSTVVIARLLIVDRGLLGFAGRVYVQIGVVNGLFAITSWLLLVYAGVDVLGAYFGGASDVPRARGFFNEGGPYGMYACSVMAVALARRYVARDIGRMAMVWVLAVMGASVVLAESKAAYLFFAAVGLWWSLRRIQLRRMVIGCAAVAVVLVWTPLPGAVEGYWYSYRALEGFAAAHPDDRLQVMGRVAAIYIAPRVVEAHPITGVGLGNYSLVRNDPRYLGALPETDGWDLPGLGLVGYAADLGLPLLGYLIWLIWRPVSIAVRRKAPNWVVLLSAYQFFAQLFGVQITFFYPWFVTAVALGYSLQADQRA